jgi:hypothetical protein
MERMSVRVSGGRENLEGHTVINEFVKVISSHASGQKSAKRELENVLESGNVSNLDNWRIGIGLTFWTCASVCLTKACARASVLVFAMAI